MLGKYNIFQQFKISTTSQKQFSSVNIFNLYIGTAIKK